MTEKRIVPIDQYLKIKDEERKVIERTSYQYAKTFGGKMKIPPELYEILKHGGVNMKYMEACEDLAGKLPPIL